MVKDSDESKDYSDKNSGNGYKKLDVEVEDKENRATECNFGVYNLSYKSAELEFLYFGIDHWCGQKLDRGGCDIWT